MEHLLELLLPGCFLREESLIFDMAFRDNVICDRGVFVGQWAVVATFAEELVAVDTQHLVRKLLKSCRKSDRRCVLGLAARACRGAPLKLPLSGKRGWFRDLLLGQLWFCGLTKC